MAKEEATSKTTKRPADPTPLAPRREAVVDASAPTLEWEGVQGALEYHVEVAEDTAFEQIVFDDKVEDATSLHVGQAFPVDEATYYWRVFARNEAGWSEGEHIESFISGSEARAATGLHDPDDDESLGPMTELVKASNIEMAADVTQSEKYFRKEREMGVAHEGVEAKQILSMVVATVITVAVLVVVLITATSVVQRDMFYSVSGTPYYPELRENERQAAEALDSYAIVNDAEGVYRIPIQRAMEMMVRDARESAGDDSLDWSVMRGR